VANSQNKPTGPRVDPIEAKTVKTASEADVKTANDTDVPVSPKALAKAKGETPVSKSVEQGDDVVRRNDYEGTLGPVAHGAKPFLSEGVRSEIEMHGVALDPVTGQTLTRDDLPKK
jgi:hypothetical protein